MTPENRKDFKFYASLLIGAAFALLGCLTPPVGAISNSMLWIVFAFLILSACIEGIDVKGIIHEIRLLKEFDLENKNNENVEKGGN